MQVARMVVSVGEFVFPEVVDLASVPQLAEALVRHIRSVPSPVATTLPVRRADVALVQMLIAANRLAGAEGKSFSVKVESDGIPVRLFATLGIDPVTCGATPDLSGTDLVAKDLSRGPTPDMHRSAADHSPCPDGADR